MSQTSYQKAALLRPHPQKQFVCHTSLPSPAHAKQMTISSLPECQRAVDLYWFVSPVLKNKMHLKAVITVELS